MDFAAWFDPRLPAPDSQQPLHSAQVHVRRLNGPKRNANVDADYAVYHELYSRYMDLRLPFLNKPRAIPLANGKIPEWEDALAQKLRDLGPNATKQHPDYIALNNATAKVEADYAAMWRDLGNVIDQLAECDYVHDFGGNKTRILDMDQKVDVTAGPPLRAWAPTIYELTTGGSRAYNLETQTIGMQGYESYYTSKQQQAGRLVIFKNPATTQYYKSLLWAAVNGH